MEKTLSCLLNSTSERIKKPVNNGDLGRLLSVTNGNKTASCYKKYRKNSKIGILLQDFIPCLLQGRLHPCWAKHTQYTAQLLGFFWACKAYYAAESHQWCTCSCPNLITSTFNIWSFQESVLWMMTLLLCRSRTATCTKRNAVILWL